MLLCAGCMSADQPSEAGWNLTMRGASEDVITQALYEESVNFCHAVQWKDKDGNVWMGMDLWMLAADVDDAESGHPTFNKALAEVGYTITVLSEDGSSVCFESSDVAGSRGYIVANSLNGEPISGDDAPLRLVGDGVSPEDRIGGIVAIELSGL